MDDKNPIDDPGKPMAHSVRCKQGPEERRPGALKGKIKIAKSFDELPGDIARAFGMEKPVAHCLGADGRVDDSNP